MIGGDGSPAPPDGFDGGTELLRFVEALAGSTSLAELGRRFAATFPPLFGVPMNGLYLVEPWTGRADLVTSANVSSAFLARYERVGRDVDSLREAILATQKPVYNIGVMSMEQWLEHPLYTDVKRLHDIRHEVQAPVVTRDGFVGSVHFGTSDPDRAFTPYELRLADAVGGAVAATIERIHHVERLEREHERMRAALSISGTAVVEVDPVLREPVLNVTARRLLADVVDAEPQLHRLLARTGGTVGRAAHLEVQLVDGSRGYLHGHTSATAGVTVLELQRGGRAPDERTLAALTPREREIALRVVEGFSDRAIAERLHLSPHTVRQHVKRIYRKVDVDSRVALTRLLLSPR
jgi:DNA-binding CsgD family transcriptional regulator